MATRKKYSPELKSRVALAAIRGDGKGSQPGKIRLILSGSRIFSVLMLLCICSAAPQFNGYF